LAEIADPGRAAGAQAYMKSAMSFLGVSAVPLRKVCRDVFKGLSWDNAADWRADVLAIWRDAEFREERYAAIEPSLDRKEFFLRKAIGWALRSYAWTDPDEVQRYVEQHEAGLSGLSKREALKNIGAVA
jgi:3-methyladenine DNA glycosylase AlkD